MTLPLFTAAPKPVRKAIFPVAGLGTRFLPATKAVPKEMMPVVDRPLIQYAIDEARAAGITDFIFVTARGKTALEDYFDRSPELEATLKEGRKTALLDILHETEMGSGSIAYVRQTERLGLGHAVWCARSMIGDEPFAVILPDDLIDARRPCLAQMVETYNRTGGNLIAAMEVAPEAVSSYGIFDTTPGLDRVTPVRAMVEKPRLADAPSRLAAIGRYILQPEVLDTLDSATPGAGGEIQLTDAIAAQIARHDNVRAFRFDGRRFDCGSHIGYLQASFAFGLARDGLGDALADFAREEMAARGLEGVARSA